MKFNPETALAYARALARPRLLGSGEDGAVAQEIAAQLEGFGCRVERQPFQFSAAFNTFVRLEVLAGQLLILAAFWAWSRSTAPWASILPAALLLALLVLIEPLNRAVEAGSLITPKSETPRSDSLSALWQAVCQRMGAKYHTANLVAGWPSLPDAPNLPHFYLVAHYDSKSQFIPIIARVILFMLVSGGAAVFAILSLLRLALPALTPFAAVVGLTALLAGLPLLLLDVGNASPGAIDNASGCGLVLGLAERLSRDASWHDRLRVTVLITSAEELAVMGAAAYVRAHEAELRQQAKAGSLYVLNFDGIGTEGKLYFAGEEGKLAELTRQACGELGLSLNHFGLIGVLFDHLPFARRGFDALTLIAIGPASWAVHTPRDSADKLHVEGFRRSGEVALRAMENLCRE